MVTLTLVSTIYDILKQGKCPRETAKRCDSQTCVKTLTKSERENSPAVKEEKQNKQSIIPKEQEA